MLSMNFESVLNENTLNEFLKCFQKDMRVPLKMVIACPTPRNVVRTQETQDGYLGTRAVLEDGYTLDVPGGRPTAVDDHEDPRTILPIPTLPMHESLAREVEHYPSMESRCRKNLQEHDWYEQYRQHPVVVSAAPGETVYPVAIYSDGVPFANRDGVLAWYAYNLISGRRHLLVCLRKSELCPCPCQKWCSLHPVWEFLRWSILALAEGVWPSQRSDGTDFTSPEDAWRKDRAGSTLMKAAVVMIKADWLEYASSFALPFWSHKWHPCFKCHATREQLTDIGNFSANESPHLAKTAMDYENACANAEMWRTIHSREQQEEVLKVLEYDFRKKGSHGRALAADVPSVGLEKNDRLAVAGNLRNIGHFEQLTPPCRVLFWRPRQSTLANRRCPLFCPEVGVSIESCTADPMHTLHLGVYKDSCMTAVWMLLEADVFTTGAGDQDTLFKVGTVRLARRLRQWYKEKKDRLVPGENIYEIGRLKLSMLGWITDPSLAIKAAETGTFIEFCRDEVRRFSHLLGDRGAAMQALLETLVDLRDHMRYGPRVFLHKRSNALQISPLGHIASARMLVFLSCQSGI